jgi:FtsH-binding integral membrane protein
MAVSSEQAQAFLRKVYAYMAGGLALTGFIAYVVAASNSAMSFLKIHPVFVMVLMIAELLLVIFLSARIHKISAEMAKFIFIAYSALNGVTLSVVFLVYTKSSIVATFFVCSGMFAAFSIYGWVTKKDLTSLGGFLIMSLFGLIIAMLVNAFIGSPALDWAISCIAVLTFVGLTAYDTQKIKAMAASIPLGASEDAVTRGAIIGALELYLDFINLMLHLLRLMGEKK